MLNVIGLTQFVFLSLGIMAVKIIEKASGGQGSPLALFLSQYGIWFFLIPSLWIVVATVSTFRNTSVAVVTVAQVTGIILTALIFFVFGAAILFS